MMDRNRKTETLLRSADKKIIGKMEHTNPLKICQKENDSSIDQIITALKKTALITPITNFIALLIYISLWLHAQSRECDFPDFL
jgi:hypothetical protein